MVTLRNYGNGFTVLTIKNGFLIYNYRSDYADETLCFKTDDEVRVWVSGRIGELTRTDPHVRGGGGVIQEYGEGGCSD